MCPDKRMCRPHRRNASMSSRTPISSAAVAQQHKHATRTMPPLATSSSGRGAPRSPVPQVAATFTAPYPAGRGRTPPLPLRCPLEACSASPSVVFDARKGGSVYLGGEAHKHHSVHRDGACFCLSSRTSAILSSIFRVCRVVPTYTIHTLHKYAFDTDYAAIIVVGVHHLGWFGATRIHYCWAGILLGNLPVVPASCRVCVAARGQHCRASQRQAHGG